MTASSLPTLHANTPEVVAAASSGVQVRALRLLRHPDTAQSVRWLTVRTHSDVLARTARQFGARPLKVSAEAAVLADATSVHGLGGQTLKLHTVDGDASFTLTDSAGRALWASNAQGTVQTHTYESVSTGGRLVGVFERAAGGAARQRERLHYGEPVAASRGRNLAGTLVAHFDNAGAIYTRSLSLGGQALETRQRLLPPDMELPDWASSSEDELEEALVMIHRVDAAGASLLQVNAAGVSTRTAYDVSAAVAQTWMSQDANETLVLKAVQRRADGVVLSKTAGNGVVDSYAHAPTSQRLMRHCTARPGHHALAWLLISDLHYTYDPVGNILSLNDQGADPVWHGNAYADGVREFAYDTFYRLACASGRERTPVSRVWSPAFAGSDRKGGDVWRRYTEQYRYDDGDNLVQLTHNGGAGARSRSLRVSAQSNRALPDDHGLTPENGFIAGGLQRQLADGRPLSWQADNQLHQVSLVRRTAGSDDTERYHYADGGRRTRKVTRQQTAGGVQTTLVTYAGGCEMRQRLLDGRLQQQVVVTEQDNVRWLHQPLGGDPQLRYGFTDHLGSSGGETDALGRLVARQEYAPYGETTGSDEDAVEVGNLLQRTLRYSGKELDATGLYYYGWRYYQPGLGRWLSADPAGTVDGANLFCMVLNNPVVRVDEKGLMFSFVPDSLVRGIRNLMGQQPPSPPETRASSPERTQQDEPPSHEQEPMPLVVVTGAGEEPAVAEQVTAIKKNRKRKKASAGQLSLPADLDDGFSTVSSRSSRSSVASSASHSSHASGRSEASARHVPQQRYATTWPDMGRYLNKLTEDGKSGVRVIGAGERPKADLHGNTVFYLTKGKGMGLDHVTGRHAKEFNDAGIPDKELPELLLKALAEGKIVPNAGKPTRPVYEVNFKGKVYYPAITVGQGGQIVGAHLDKTLAYPHGNEARAHAFR